MKKVLYILARLLAAIIMLQTLYFKFGSDPESVFIFTKLGMEPWGRYLTGVFELLASVLLLIPATSWIGGIVGLGLMLGALIMHFTELGVEVQGDGGLLFGMAWTVFVCCLYVVSYSWKEIREVWNALVS